MRGRPKRRILERRLVLVSLKSGAGIRGILWEHVGDLYELRSAEYLDADRAPVRLDGTVVVDLANVDFIQVLPGPMPVAAPPPVALVNG